MTRAVAVLLVLALALGSAGLVALLVVDRDGGRPGVSAPSFHPEPGAAEPPSPGLARYYSQRLAWKPCRDDDFCATLTVPLDYRHPRAAAIDLAVLVVPAEDPDARIGSLVVNPGGPGGSGTDYAAAADAAFGHPIRQVYDVVGVDPRGTGDSAAVDCLSDDELDEYVAQDPDPDTAAEEREYAGWVQALGAGCVRGSRDLAAHVTTVEAARDLDVLRAALGESELDYFGASYGTKLGATYADLFPDRVGRAVLDGALDLSLSSRELSLQQAAGFETALRSYVRHCVDGGDGGDEGDDCFLGDSLDAGLARIRALLDDVDARPLATDSDRQLEIGNAFYGLVMPLYSRDTWPFLDEALQQALDGDGTLLLRASDAYASRGSTGYAGNRLEANYAISCLDDPWAITPAEVSANLADFERASPTFGSVFAWGLTACGGQQARATEHDRIIDAAGAPPIVVVGTTRDPATPYQWAVDLAGQLDSAVLVTRDGDGHTGYRSGNDCVDDAVEAYLIDGTVPADGLTC